MLVHKILRKQDYNKSKKEQENTENKKVKGQKIKM